MKLVKLEFRVGGVEDFNLNLTLKPSFVSSLYTKSGDSWIKVSGLLAGDLVVTYVDGVLTVYSKACGDGDLLREVALCETGLWDEPPRARISKLKGKLRDQVEALSQLYPGVRLSISPHDFNCIFIAVVLSKRTRYDVFVKRWVGELWRRWMCDLEVLAKLSISDLKPVGSSYQLQDMLEALRDFVNLDVDLTDVAEARRRLMACRGVGPKVADATLLFTTKSPWIVPCDTHLKRVSKRLGWVNGDVRMPSKQLCLRYYCDECMSKYGECLKVAIERLFPGFGGWVQTLTYLFGSSTCRAQRPLCERCHPTLAEYCVEARRRPLSSRRRSKDFV